MLYKLTMQGAEHFIRAATLAHACALAGIAFDYSGTLEPVGNAVPSNVGTTVYDRAAATKDKRAARAERIEKKTVRAQSVTSVDVDRANDAAGRLLALLR